MDTNLITIAENTTAIVSALNQISIQALVGIGWLATIAWILFAKKK